jgi:MFS transporter, DHA2 family, multidrug resistance protein
LTDTYSWHWLFLVNIVPGILVATAVWFLIDVDKPDRSLLRYFDLFGLVLMAVFLGCLEYVLEEGARWDWFADDTIFTAAVVSAIAAGLFFWRVLSYRQPIVDLRAFMNRNFALGSFYTFVIGTGHFGATYVLPLFLAQIRGYSSWQIGMTVVVTGVAQILVSPMTAMLSRKMDLRLMLSLGAGPVCGRGLSECRSHQPGELCRAIGAAGVARRRADVLLPSGQSDRPRHLASRQAKKTPPGSTI